MAIFGTAKSGRKARRHFSVAAGLAALWLQWIAYAAPMPWMASGADDSGRAAMAAMGCLDGGKSDGKSDGKSGGKSAPDGKSSTQCPLCQTLQILGSNPVPPSFDIVHPVLASPPVAGIAIDARAVIDRPVTGFLSRAPPVA